jgi:hypothetical protein
VKPFPVPLDGALRSERQILQHRKLTCPQYSGCLNQSVRAGWESFSCQQCPLARLVDEEQEALSYATQRRGDRYNV